MRTLRALLILTLLVLARESFADNVMIGFSLDGMASGLLNGEPFQNKELLLQVMTNTAGITEKDGVYTNAVTMGGLYLGSRGADILTPLNVFDDNNKSIFGLSRVSNGVELFDAGNPAFANYDLAHGMVDLDVNIGGLQYSRCEFGCFETTLGTLQIDEWELVTFQIIDGQREVPEPGSLVLLGTLVAATGLRRWVLR